MQVFVRKLLHRRPLPLLISGLLFIAPLLIAAPTAAIAQSSMMMPHAKQSLLLDGQIIGDRIIVVGERGHILISEDNGITWEQQEVPSRVTLTSVFFTDPANGWAAGHDSIILQTIDGGRHWQEVYANPEDERPILDLWFKDLVHGYAVGAYGLFLMTHDGGRSWQEISFEPATLVIDESMSENPWAEETEADSLESIDFHLNQISATTEGRVLVAAEAGNLYRSDDGCRSWLRLPSPYEGSFYGNLPLAQNKVLAYGLRGHLFLSEDAGITWTAVSIDSQATINDGIRLHDGRIVLAGLAGTLLISSDEGMTFQLRALANRDGIAKLLQASDGALILIGEHGVKRLQLPETPEETGR